MVRLPVEAYFTNSQKKRWLAVMPRRFSCRVFSGPADVPQLAALSYTAQSVCPRGIRIELASRGAEELVVALPLFPRFSGFTQYAVVLARGGLQHAEFLAGLAAEALALEMASLGLSCCIMMGNYRRKIAQAAARDEEYVVAVMPFGVPEDPEGARDRKRKPLTAFCPDDPALWPLWAYQAAEAVRSAPSAMNRQPWQMSCAGSTFSLKTPKLDSMDTGIALCHLQCAAGGYAHALRLGSDLKTFLLTIKEDNRQKTPTSPETEEPDA
jgi:hypothetical protein